MKLVLVPLKKELEALVSVLNGAVKNQDRYQYKDYQFVVGGLGKVNFALNTYKYSQVFRPEEVFAVGSCGSLKDNALLDLVVVDKAVEHDFDTSLLPDFLKPQSLQCESLNFEHLKRVFCASGDKSVLSTEDKQELKRRFPEAQIVSWETAGFFKAAKALGLPFTEVRVVTDHADSKGLVDFNKNLTEGMQKVGLLFK